MWCGAHRLASIYENNSYSKYWVNCMLRLRFWSHLVSGNWLVHSFLEIKQTWDMFAVFKKYAMSKAWSTLKRTKQNSKHQKGAQQEENWSIIYHPLNDVRVLLQIIVKIESIDRSISVIMCTSINRSRRDNIQASGEANTKALSGWKGQTVLGNKQERSWETWMEPGGGTPSGRLAV